MEKTRSIDDLRLLGMFVESGVFENSFHSRGYPLCYSPQIEGGYGFVHPPVNDFSFRDFARLPGQSVLIPNLLEYARRDLMGAAVSSAVSTDFSTSDVPGMIDRLEGELLTRKSGK